MRIPAYGGRLGRLVAKLAVIPIAALAVAACTEPDKQIHQTGDTAPPGLIGETANGIGFPHEVVTTEGMAAAGLYIYVFIIAVVIFLLIEGLLLFMTWRFRRRGTDGELPKQVHGNNRLEVIWTVIPAIIVTAMFVGSAMVLADIESMSEEPGVTVDVTAYQFGWNFDYPDHGVSAPLEEGQIAKEMVVPVDEPIRFRLHTAEAGVIHSFYVPAFFFKRDIIPGKLNEFEVTIEKPGVYGGQCAEFCGLGHGVMYFNVRAVERPEYESWLADQAMAAAASGAPPPGTGDASPPAPEAETTDRLLEIATVADKPIAYTTDSLNAKVGETVTVRYTNDSEVPHNITFYDGPDATSEQIAKSDDITGPGAQTEVSFVAPTTPGAYLFRCELHPAQMIGTLTISP